MSGVRSFTDLLIWQKSRVWSKDIFCCTRDRPFYEDRRLVVQITDSSESVMSNIAEGFGRGTQGEFVTFLGYAIGSLNETQSHLAAAYDRRYLSKQAYREFFASGTEIRKMTVSFIKSMVKHGSGVKHLRRQKSWTDEVWERFERITGQERPELFKPNSRATAVNIHGEQG